MIEDLPTLPSPIMAREQLSTSAIFLPALWTLVTVSNFTTCGKFFRLTQSTLNAATAPWWFLKDFYTSIIDTYMYFICNKIVLKSYIDDDPHNTPNSGSFQCLYNGNKTRKLKKRCFKEAAEMLCYDTRYPDRPCNSEPRTRFEILALHFVYFADLQRKSLYVTCQQLMILKRFSELFSRHL